MPDVGISPGDSGWSEAFSYWSDLNWPTPERTLNSQGSFYYVDAHGGSDSNDGTSWDVPLLTMEAAFDKLSSGDTIFFHGKVQEQLTTPVEVFDVTIVGVGNRPRHIDGTPKAGSHSASMWTTTAVEDADAPLVKVLQQGWRFVNILFVGPSAAECVQLFRDNGDGDAERDAGHAEFHNCRFASGQDGIAFKDGCGFVGIYGCFFQNMTGFAIKDLGTAYGYHHWCEMIGNRFLDNANVLKMVCKGWVIRNNSFVNTTTEVLDTDNGDAEAGYNVVVGNYFNIAANDFDPAGKVVGNGTDVWSNTLKDAIETGTPAN